MIDTMPASAILVANRHRRDHGDLQALAESIQDVGLLHPVVVTPEGVLIAGGRRYTAVTEVLGWADVPVRVIVDLDDAGRVLAERDENTQRKALAPTEAEALATTIEAELKPMAEQRKGGRPKTGAESAPVTQPKTRHIAAAATGLSHDSIAKVRAVKAVAEDAAAPDAVREVATAALAEMDRTGKVNAAHKKVVAAGRKAAQPPSPPADAELAAGQFCTIVADPPWRYSNTSTRGAAEDHYPTMSIEELCALDVAREAAADKSHLYLWTTAGHLPDAFKVMAAWGFEYKTYLVWVKPQMGMGNYFRVSTELVLFGVRGGLGTNDQGLKNYFEAPRGRHSAKPTAFHDLVTQASTGPYLEMFARCDAADLLHSCQCSKCRLGWRTWGDQT